MTQRKPAHVPVHTWVDQLIRDAQERGEFDDLPGAGKPLPGIDKPLDEDWWVRQKVRDEELPADGLLPPALQLRKELAALPENVRHLRDEESVRALVRDVNARVAEFFRSPTGPVLPVAPANLEAVVDRWRQERAANEGGDDGATSTRSASPARATPRRRRRRWWWPWGSRTSPE